MNIKEYSDIFVIKKERDDYVIKEYIGNVEGTLNIPEGITKISQFAFSYHNQNINKIKKIIFPKTLKRIPEYNFEYLEQLEEVIIPEGVNSIANSAFFASGLREVFLPSTIDKVGKSAFCCCDNLRKITVLHITSNLLNSLLSKDYSLYFGYSEDIEFSQYFKKYHDIRDEKTKFSLNGSFVMYGDYVIGYIGKEKDIVIPDTAKGIAWEAFIFNKNIQSVKMGKKVKTIGRSAFKGCVSLRTVSLNESLEKMGNYVFADTGLIDITIPMKVDYVGEGAFDGCKKLIRITTVKKLFGDDYRFAQWNEFWDAGFYKEKKIEYFDNF